uniref:Glycosyl transferase family 2 n=1 Tax=Candidatus Kentrum sp. FW TaxID=2126338 RepID=A0A450SUP6_9GAMM|nr:MAG: Glycosyl transferase family 2 [Candidatus Kentron sp. FW]VFJ57704.1 MAG: Glycosyl transferase family 2 [Candidatus Kentron sp. FW]
MIISIIIPTRERADYLRESIQTVLQIPDPNIEIIISDNANSDGTKQVISEISDPRIKHVETDKRVSVRENFEFGLRNSNGDYVTFLGDDDGVLPRQFKFLRRILEKEHPDVLTWTVPPTFIWPGKRDGEKIGGVRFDKKNLFHGIHRIDGEAHKKCLLACDDLGHIRFPMIYGAGCASRDYFERIAAPDGTYFNSSVPDSYFAYRSLLKGGNFLHVDHPFSLPGHAPNSVAKVYDILPDTDDLQTGPYHRFMVESELDNVTDVIPHTLSLPLLAFSTLETVRARFPEEDQIPDYLAWYKYVLSDNSVWHDAAKGILREYATKSGTLSEFDQAESEQVNNHGTKTHRKVSPDSRKTFSKVKEMIRNRATRFPIFPAPKKFRLSTEIARENTILTATNIYDSILADNYEHVLDGTGSRSVLWKQVVKRSRIYPI